MASCNFCFHEYTEEGPQTPKILSCGHSACAQCVSTWPENIAKICNRCDVPLEGKASQLGTNYALIEAIEMSKYPRCLYHEDAAWNHRDAWRVCLDCNTLICENCFINEHAEHSVEGFKFQAEHYQNQLSDIRRRVEEDIEYLKAKIEHANRDKQTNEPDHEQFQDALSQIRFVASLNDISSEQQGKAFAKLKRKCEYVVFKILGDIVELQVARQKSEKLKAEIKRLQDMKPWELVTQRETVEEVMNLHARNIIPQYVGGQLHQVFPVFSNNGTMTLKHMTVVRCTDWSENYRVSQDLMNYLKEEHHAYETIKERGRCFIINMTGNILGICFCRDPIESEHQRKTLQFHKQEEKNTCLNFDEGEEEFGVTAFTVIDYTVEGKYAEEQWFDEKHDAYVCLLRMLYRMHKMILE